MLILNFSWNISSRWLRTWMLCTILLLGASALSAGCGADADEGARDEAMQPDAGADAQSDAAPSSDAISDSGEAPDIHSGPRLPLRPWAVDEPGPYQVGFTLRSVTYDARGTDEPRTLRLAIWYPTFDTDGRMADYFNLINRPGILRDASVALSAPAPLLVFSHGNAAMAEQSYFMAEFFASHGWIVAAPDHTNNTLTDTMGAIDLTTAVFRPQDISAVLDFLFDLDEDDLLAGFISRDNIVMSGHSFGGFTTLASAGASIAVDTLSQYCEDHSDDMCDILDGHSDWADILRQGFLDPRIKAAIPQAPGGHVAFLGGEADIRIPTLLFTGGMDRTLKPEEEGNPIWAAMRGPQHLRVNLPSAGHFTFSNMCDVLSGIIDELENDGCGPDFVAPATGYEIINAYSLSFARHVLFKDRSTRALLSSEVQPYEDLVELSRKAAAP